MNNKVIIGLLMENKKPFIIAIVSVLISSALFLMPSIITGYVVEDLLGAYSGVESSYDAPAVMDFLVNILGGREYLSERIWVLSLVLIVIGLLIGLFTHLRVKYVAIGANDMAYKLRNIVFEKLMKMEYFHYSLMNSGDLIQRCTSDINKVYSFYGVQIIEVVKIIGLAVPSIILLFTINVQLALYSIVMLPFIFAFSFLIRSKLDKLHEEVELKEATLTTTIQENTNGIRVVKAFNKQNYEIDKFTKYNEDLAENIKKLLRGYGLFWSFSDLLCLTQYIIVIGTCAYAGYKGVLSLGDYIIFVSCANRYIYPLRQLSRMVGEFSKTKVAVDRINEILELKFEDSLDTGLTPEINGNIEIKDVSFAFQDDPNTEVLKHIDLSIKNGESVGILGTTGSGKSTLMHLLVRLFDVEDGSITINGVDVKEINKKHLRENISIVLQDNFLYAKSIFDNIKLANPTSQENDVYKVTNIASVHRTIEKFDEGYETLVGEKGVTLSGGQKQRVAIARTLIKDSKVVIFDDSLSAVDVETDNRIRSRLKDHNKELTTIIVAQRISTLVECDRIVVMENGEITQMGNHEELIEKEGLYKKIWEIQTSDIV
ncbi:MAG: ABC transporter ATP-binding protein [Lachnospirales bacterium]